MYGNSNMAPMGRNGKVTVRTLQKKKESKEPITMVTAYDATFAKLVDDGGVDAILVGDSLGMVIQGHENTLPVTLDDMIYHCKAVRRGSHRCHVVGDLPFMSYQVSEEDGLRNAGRLMKEAGVAAVKLEGGEEVAPLVRRLVNSGIPVMGHVGLMPQSVHLLGGFRVQGRGDAQADKVRQSAQALQDAGAYALVLESVPHALATGITKSLKIPTVGIGAGPGCDGQVLVIYDLLGMYPDFSPKFVKKYDNLAGRVVSAVEAYVEDVRNGHFPGEEHTFR